MALTNKKDNLFYHQLGKLFYAVAAADNVVKDEEFSRLKSCIHDYWLDLDDLEDAFGSDAAYLIEIVFEGVEAFNEDPQDMYDAFITYRNKQPQFFTLEVKNIILQTAWTIARAFSGVNKSELVMLGKLEMALSH
ncbi:hypothetical protein [Dokdonia sp. Asnod1-B02]|uniref:hypothetical protein n=1 Tax=Dokdonia sp. Asnod1-B02 TaxID=3160573 RepID=UPI00386B1EA1